MLVSVSREGAAAAAFAGAAAFFFRPAPRRFVERSAFSFLKTATAATGYRCVRPDPSDGIRSW